MTRIIDKTGRIYISQKWRQRCKDSIAIISVSSEGISLHPYKPQKHNLEGLLYRKLDDHARLKIPPDILRALGFSTQEEYHLYIGSDDTALLRPTGDYCDICGQETQTKMILGRSVCETCFEILKRCE